MKKIRWNKRKFINNIKDLLIGTSFITLPILGCLVYGLICNMLGF